MDGVIDIESWAREVAEAEGRAALRLVRDAVLTGAGTRSALDEITGRFARLTPEQRAMAVASIGYADDRAPHAA
ncbi:MAG: hypothetical protein AB7V42_07595 [Thermoleophilia bacterium]